MTDAIALLLLVYCSWDWYRLVRSPNFSESFPWLQRGMAVGGLFWIMVIGSLFVAYPRALRLLSGLLVFARLYRRWLDRRATGYPPGPRDLLATFRSLIEPDFYQACRSRHGEIFKTSQFHHNVICLVSLERFQELQAVHGKDLEPCPLPFHHHLAAGFLRYMRPEHYQVYGPLFRRALSREVQNRAGEAARSILPSRLSDVAEGRCDFHQAMEETVFQAFLSSLFGLAPASPLYRDFVEGYRSFSQQPYGEHPTAKTIADLHRLCRFLQREELYSDSNSALSQFRELGNGLPDQACLENLLYIVRMSVGNVVGLLHWLMVVLAEHPVWLDRLREGSSDGDVADRVVRETLRLHQSEYLYRRIGRTFSYRGFEFPAGWLVRVCVRECHRDPAHFSSPQEFDPDRFRQPIKVKRYSPFGMSTHACNGISINRSICLAFLESLAARYRLEMLKPVTPHRELRHWSHWRPAGKVRLSPLDSVSPGVEVELR